MIEERARIVAMGSEGVAWVETQRQTACDACVAHEGCGTATLAKALGQRRTRLRVITPIPVRTDDEVIIGIDEHSLLKGSVIVYMVPLLTMFLGALGGATIFPASSEGFTVLMGLLGLAGGFVRLPIFTRIRRTDSRFRPVVLRRLEATDKLLASSGSS